MGFFGKVQLAQVQYYGSNRTTQSCLDAIARLLSTGAQIDRAILLTHQNQHGFFLEMQEPEPVLIRCGFTSGYSGEGPAGLSIAIHMLERFNVGLEEVLVPGEFLTRLDESRLTQADMNFITRAPSVRPTRIYDYRHDGLEHRGGSADLIRRQFRPVVPWFAIDDRLVDLAVVLERNADKAVFDAFRRLESQVKKRCILPVAVSGVEVFKKAFRGTGALLTWPGLPRGEIEGRAQLFEAAFMTYRNPRAHREDEWGHVRAYREFFIANELFLLEAEAVEASS